MITKSKRLLLSLGLTVLSFHFVSSQNQSKEEEKYDKYVNNKFTFLNYRGPNAIDIAAGTTIINGDYEDPEFEAYFKIGYKQHITSHLNINFTYNKYNIAYKEFYNEGFMSFDLNLELLLSPYRRFSPFIYAGGGYNASNYFENTMTKAQGGLGFEVIVADRIGLKLFGEYNYLFSDELDGLIAGESDDTFIRVGFGMNIYFGGIKKRDKLSKKIKTVINSNPIIPNN